MSQSTNNNQEDLLNIKSSSDNTHSSDSHLIKYTAIENTPFKLIKQNEEYFIVMGSHRLTEPTQTKNEQYIKLEKEKWKILTNVIIIITETIINTRLKNNLEIPKTEDKLVEN